MQIGRSGHRHRIRALMIGGRIAHFRKHVLQWKDARGFCGSAGFFCRDCACLSIGRRFCDRVPWRLII
jgi:hypothetical protein